jgi:hypothetical protein
LLVDGQALTGPFPDHFEGRPVHPRSVGNLPGGLGFVSMCPEILGEAGPVLVRRCTSKSGAVLVDPGGRRAQSEHEACS